MQDISHRVIEPEYYFAQCMTQLTVEFWSFSLYREENFHDMTFIEYIEFHNHYPQEWQTMSDSDIELELETEDLDLDLELDLNIPCAAGA